MLSVAGVDLGGKRAHVCILQPSSLREPSFYAFVPEEKNLGHVDAVCRAAVWARLRFLQTPPSVCWLERPFGRFPEANFQLSLMAGAIMAGLPPECSVDLVSATECRKLVGVPARAEKKEIRGWAQKETGLNLDEDSADAYVVARAVLAFGAKEGAA